MAFVLYAILFAFTVDHMVFSFPPDNTISSSEEDILLEVKALKSKLHRRSVSVATRESCETTSEVPVNRENTTDRLRRLRLRMKASSYDAYIVPSDDEHQSEFVADHDKRREFITGFSGSAGTAVILQNLAALWTDGRYFLQAEKELDCNWILMKRNIEGTPSVNEWLIQNLHAGAVVGADSKIIPYKKWLHLKEELEKLKINLIEDESNLIDDIWSIPQGRAPESVSHLFVHDVKYAGKTWEEKVRIVRNILKEEEVDGIIITALDEIAWLFNLRGLDVSYTPVFKAYAFVSENHLRLYVKHLKLTPEIERFLCPRITNESECVQVDEYNNAFQSMERLVADLKQVMVPSSSSYAIMNLVPKEKRVIEAGPSLVSKLKVIKNSVEVTGMKNAALKDCVAIIDFIAMLDEEVKNGKHWDEMKAAKTLKRYRQEQELNQGESFPAISAFGSNGAIIHYTPQILTNRNINTKHLYLLDSGGQYLDGTTDITRTFHFGEPTEFEMETYTRVLMGVIDLMIAVFPSGVRDIDLDIFARQPLYRIGLDYLHGTGHGIGNFLAVHEGPVLIADVKKSAYKGFELKPGMFLSNEPGFYQPQKFGIRLETMMTVVKAHTPHHFNGHKYYTFEPVSFIPFEPKLINLRLLSKKQKEWLNWYNMKTRNSVGIEMQRQNRKKGLHWLLSKTEYIPVEECPNHATSLYSSYIKPSTFITLIFSVMAIL